MQIEKLSFLENNLIEENPVDKNKRCAIDVIRKLTEANKQDVPLTKKAINETIKGVNGSAKLEDIIELEIEIDNITYMIEKSVPVGKKMEKIYIRIKQ